MAMQHGKQRDILRARDSHVARRAERSLDISLDISLDDPHGEASSCSAKPASHVFPLTVSAITCPVLAMQNHMPLTLGINGVAFFCAISFLVYAHNRSAKHRRKMWFASMLTFSTVWSIALSTMSLEALHTIVERDPVTRDGVRLAHLMAGVVHYTISRGRARSTFGEELITLGLACAIQTLCGGGALCLRLGDLSLMRLPLFNVCVPLIGGYLVALSAKNPDPLDGKDLIKFDEAFTK